jgi:ribosome biogenesis GTPase
LLASRADSSADSLKGTVIAAFGRQCAVELADGSLLSCVTRGKRTGIACGDNVAVKATAVGDGVIESVAPRRSLFYRSDLQREKLIASNVTQVAVVVAAAPPLHRELLDRCLAAAEHASIKVLVVFNKMDLPGAQAALDTLSDYRALDYEVLPVAAKLDIAPLRSRLDGHTSVLVGQSGMGKSTIINRLLPDAAARVGELSKALGGGRHTTTHAQLYHLDPASRIIDSPGLQEFGLLHVGSGGLAECFVEFRTHLGACKFNDCKHLSEPGCAITAAAASGAISRLRLDSYRKLFAQLVKKEKRW